jgi:PIN domain nuclease of toxin-antitoxin system
MDSVVMDASAILALLNQEPGQEVVEEYLPRSMLSAVNASEVMAVLTGIGLSIDDAEDMLSKLIKEVVPFDRYLAVIAAGLRQTTKKLGLSFGDRACLALAKRRRTPALTADRSWTKLNIDVDIRLIR